MRIPVLLVLCLSLVIAARATNPQKCFSQKQGNDAAGECMISFIQSQINQKSGLTATYKSDVEKLRNRADVYDASLALMALLEADKMHDADDLAAALLATIESDGRARVAYSALSNQALDSSVMTGPLAFQILALARHYLKTNEYDYLKGATKIGSFIQNNLYSPEGGYYGGFSGNNVKFTWRIVEHNAALYAAARLLNNIRPNEIWQNMMTHTALFINQNWNEQTGSFSSGFNNNIDTNDEVNSQVWVALLDSSDFDATRVNRAISWVVNNALIGSRIDSRATPGVKFSTRNTDSVTEVIASTSMALSFGDDTLSIYSRNLVSSLIVLQQFSPNGDGHGLVAALSPQLAGDAVGFLPYLQTSATSWSALALMYSSNKYANPFADYSRKYAPSTPSPVKITRSVQQQGSTTGQSDDQAYTYSIAALVISCVAAGLCLVFVIIAVVVNVLICFRFFNKYTEEEERRDQEIERLQQAQNKYMFATDIPGMNSPVPLSPNSPTGLYIETSPIALKPRIDTTTRVLSPTTSDRLESPTTETGIPVMMVPGINLHD